MAQLRDASGPYADHSDFSVAITLCMGVGFTACGVISALMAWSSRPDWFDYSTYGPLAFLGFGGMMLYGSVYGGKIVSKLGPAEAIISEYEVRLGDTIHFSFWQDWRRETRVNYVQVFLVYRERVKCYDGSETQIVDFDRLVQQFEQSGRNYLPGDSVAEKCNFQIPTQNMGIRNPYMQRKDAKFRTMWVIKVRINLGKYEDIWKEYEVEVSSDARKTLVREILEEQEQRFDVLFIKGEFFAPLRTSNVVGELLPHLRLQQVGELMSTSPALLLENVAENDALRAQSRLEVAGAVVEIRPHF